MVSSTYHIEMSPSDLGHQDRIIIQEVIKEIAQNQNIDGTTQKDFKVVVLNEVDKLTRDAQHALRRTMEKYMNSCRLILCCNSTSKVNYPLPYNSTPEQTNYLYRSLSQSAVVAWHCVYQHPLKRR